MTPEKIYEQLVSRIKELEKICKRRAWSVTYGPVVKRPASNRLINRIENRIGKQIPDDLKELFRMSRKVEFSYQFDQPLSEEFKGNFSGHISWNLKNLPNQVNDFKEWIDAFLDPEFNDHDYVDKCKDDWKNMLPLINVPNGDVIAVNLNPSEIVYFSHECDVMHGKVLGKNLWEFLDFHTRIGFAGSEDWQFEPFFDFEKDEMITKGQKVERFIKLLEE